MVRWQKIDRPQRSAPRIAEKHGKRAFSSFNVFAEFCCTLDRRSARLLSETNSAAISVAPLQRQKIRRSLNLGKRTEPEQRCSDTVPSPLWVARRVDHRLDPLLIRRDEQHPEISPAEFPLMLLRRMRYEIHLHLAGNAGLLRIRAEHRHRAAI